MGREYHHQGGAKYRTDSPPCWLIQADRGRQEFIGVFWFDAGPLPAHLDAYRCAAFRTRKAARQALKSVQPSWPRARVVRAMMFVIENDGKRMAPQAISDSSSAGSALPAPPRRRPLLREVNGGAIRGVTTSLGPSKLEVELWGDGAVNTRIRIGEMFALEFASALLRRVLEAWHMDWDEGDLAEQPISPWGDGVPNAPSDPPRPSESRPETTE